MKTTRSMDFSDFKFMFEDPEEESLKARVRGNEEFKNNKYLDALLYYNQSLAHAKLGSKNLGLAYANRAAVYLNLKLFDHCLANLKLAVENNYPKEKRAKLKAREQECKKEMKMQKNDQSDPVKQYESITGEFFKLSHEPSKKLPFVSGCILMKRDMKHGTKIISNKPLAVGDIIAIEPPFGGSLQRDSRFVRCATCFKHNFMSLLPCSGCRSLMFCSEQCKNIANQRFHKYQCDRLDKVFPSVSHLWFQVALKQFMESMSMLDKNVAGLESFFEDCTWKPRNLFNVNLGKSRESANEKMKVAIVNSLKPKLKKKSMNGAGMTDMHLNFYPNLNSKLCCHECRDFGEKIITKYCDNIFIDASEDDNKNFWFGAVYFLRSHMNHSCVPNVSTAIIDEGKMVYIVDVPVPAGGQLFIDHAPEYSTLPVPVRQVKMLRECNFKCSCDECVNYPSETIKTVDDDSTDFDELVEETFDWNAVESAEKFRGNYRCLQENFTTYSRQQINNLKEVNKILMMNISIPDVFRDFYE